MVALRVSLLYLGMVWYDNIKDNIRDDIYQRSIKYVHIPTHPYVHVHVDKEQLLHIGWRKERMLYY